MFPEALPLDVGNLVNGQHPLARGLVSWWLVLPQSMGGTRLRNLVGADAATFGGMTGARTATSGWNVTRRRGGFGEIRLATDDRLIVPDHDKYTFVSAGQDQPFTISCALWLNDITQTAGVMLKWQNTVAGDWEWACYIAGSNLMWEMYQGVNADGIGRLLTMTTALYQQQWVTLTCTYTGSATASGCAIYRNGVRVDTTDSVFGAPYVSMANTTSEVSFGAFAGAANFLNGRLDDLRIWNRVLSPSEILRHYQNQHAGYPGLLNRLPWDTLGWVPRGRRTPKPPTRVWRKVS